ncbi:hypothetical protein CPB84DRAFT_1789741, partial [Gymnopilus junonius]
HDWGRTEPKTISLSTWYRHANFRSTTVTSYTTFLAEQPHLQHATTVNSTASVSSSESDTAGSSHCSESPRPPPSKRVHLEQSAEVAGIALEEGRVVDDNGHRDADTEDPLLNREGAAEGEGEPEVGQPIEQHNNDTMSDMYMPVSEEIRIFSLLEYHPYCVCRNLRIQL